jgi:hypothetical protein
MVKYREGLQRIFVVAVILWELLCLGGFIIASKAQSFRHGDPSTLLVLFGYMILPPVFTYLVGFIVMPWIIRGFKQ